MKMILLVLFYCAFLKSALSVSVEDVLQVNVRPTKLETSLENSTSSDENALNIVKSLEASSNVNNLYNGKNDNETFFLQTTSLDRVEKYSEVSRVKNNETHEKKIENSLTTKMKEYFFLSNVTGKVIITDTGLNVIAYHYLPEIAYGIGAVVNNKFYNIDTKKGQIISTDIENLIKSENFTWDIVGIFPKEPYSIRNQVAVDESSIYFVTNTGIVYVYNTTTKATVKMGNVLSSYSFAALLIVDKILYIQKNSYFYSVNGTIINRIIPPEAKVSCGLFKWKNLVCRVGGNPSVTSNDTVSCYDPISDQWSVIATLDMFLLYPGITTAEFGVYVFGGYKYVSGSQGWSDSCFLLNPENLSLGYIPCPFTKWAYTQAISFYH